MLLFFLLIKNPSHTFIADFSKENVTIPSHYNFLEEYPECDFGPLVQNCGCCYAITPLKSLAHRFCRATHKQIVFSHQYMINCDEFNLGCNGGNERTVFYYLEQHGVPDINCHPWRAEKVYNPGVCKKCMDGKRMKLYKAVKKSTKHYIGIDNIKLGIMLEGPVSASLVSDNNFVWYREGLYTSTNNGQDYNNMANHTVEIHGWGTFDNGTQYWIVQNAFGTKWGHQGLMEMKLGSNEGYVESGIYAAMPDLNSLFDDDDL